MKEEVEVEERIPCLDVDGWVDGWIDRQTGWGCINEMKRVTECSLPSQGKSEAMCMCWGMKGGGGKGRKEGV